LTNTTPPFIECEQLHAGLAVSDIPVAIDFYTTKLGFQQGFPWGEPPTFAGVNPGNVQIFLAKGTPTPSQETGAAYFVAGDADQLPSSTAPMASRSRWLSKTVRAACATTRCATRMATTLC
jgi:catechol 2,3-dioxygenase-like lactoylglutathione lyase family enzyme